MSDITKQWLKAVVPPGTDNPNNGGLFSLPIYEFKSVDFPYLNYRWELQIWPKSSNGHAVDIRFLGGGDIRLGHYGQKGPCHHQLDIECVHSRVEFRLLCKMLGVKLKDDPDVAV